MSILKPAVPRKADVLLTELRGLIESARHRAAQNTVRPKPARRKKGDDA